MGSRFSRAETSAPLTLSTYAVHVLATIHRCRALLCGVLLGTALLSCQAQRPTPPANHADNAEPVPILTYRPHPDADAMVRAEYARIDAELVAHFDYDTGHQPVFSASDELLGGWVFSRESPWPATLAAREGYEARIDHIIEAQPSPALTVRALARRGSLSDSMLRGLMSLEERGFVLVSPTLHAQFERAASLEGMPSAEEQERIVREAFEGWRKSETDALVERTIAAYAWAAVIARRYGVPFDVIRKRLETLRAQVGAKRFGEVVYRGAPPAGLAPQYERLVENDLGLLPPTSVP